MQLIRVPPGLQYLRRVGIVYNSCVDAPLTNTERGLQRFEHTAPIGPGDPETILNHAQRSDRAGRGSLAFAALLLNRWSRDYGGLAKKPRVPLLLQQAPDFRLGEV